MSALVLTRARVFDESAGSGGLRDIVVADGRIVRVAPAGESAAHGADTLDLDGRWVVPGLWDHHVHMGQWTLWSRHSSVADCGSAAQVAARARSDGPDETGMRIYAGARPGLWPDTPHKDLLDVAHPVVAVSTDAHSMWLNQVALDRFGYSSHPTGVLVETDNFAVLKALHDVTAAQLDTWVAEAADRAAARGVVGIVDVEWAWNVADWQRRGAAGLDSLRVVAGFYPEHLDRALAEGWRTGQRVSDRLEFGPLKVISDGSLGTRTAACSRPYPDGTHGQLNQTEAQLEDWVRRARDGGIESAIHAIGDEANRIALDVFGRTRATGSIEHAQQVLPDDVARFAALNVVASVQPEHAMDDRELVDRYWADAAGVYRLRSLLDAGATLRFGSDAPVAPLDPWLGIAAAVTRMREPELGPWRPEEAVTVGAAVTASARTRIAAGEPADIVVLDDDPRDPERLRTMPVAATLLAGAFTHRTL